MKKQKKISALYTPKYINKDSVDYIKCAISTEQEEIMPFDVTHKLFRFGEVTVSTHSIPVVLYTSKVCTNEYMKEWNIDNGRFFCTDLRRGNKDLYYEITTSLVRALVRQVTEEESAEDEFAKFPKVKLGDFEYAIIKVVGIDYDYNREDINTCELRDISDDKMKLFEYESDIDRAANEASYNKTNEPIYIDESISTEFDFSDEDE